MIADVLNLAVIAVNGIFDALRSNYLDGISLMIIFITIALFEVIIDFIFTLLDIASYDAEPKPKAPKK